MTTDDGYEFTEDQITDQIAHLGDYDKYDVRSTLAAGEYDPSVIVAFANVAKSMRLAVHFNYDGMQARELKPRDELRSNAVTRLRYRRDRGEI